MPFVVVVVLGIVASPGHVPAESERGRTSSPTVAATVGSEVITVEEVERAASAQLAQLEQRRFALIRQKLDELIGERLVAQEAARRGVTPGRLMKDAVYDHVPQVTDAEVKAFLANNRSRLGKGTEKELVALARNYLQTEKVSETQKAFVASLRTQHPVTIDLQELRAARGEPDGRGFSRGPAGAPVTIVEFSDFQCPFCRASVPTLKQVLDRYPGKVRWVFRDFPIAALHPNAPAAHEAARCAGDQDKFWDYHDLLFQRSGDLSPQKLKAYAAELGLDATAFARCLDTGRYRRSVASDIQDGARLGVTVTPTFYVNGRRLEGALPLEVFERAIEGEIARDAKR
jgi:protein-disulfide isomerase